MIHPLGKAWDQPELREIKFVFGKAWVSKENFNKIKTYEISIPSGVYAGKMWKRPFRVKGKDGKSTLTRWLLLWFVDSEEKDCCEIKEIELMID